MNYKWIRRLLCVGLVATGRQLLISWVIPDYLGVCVLLFCAWTMMVGIELTVAEQKG